MSVVLYERGLVFVFVGFAAVTIVILGHDDDGSTVCDTLDGAVKKCKMKDL